MLKYFEFFFYGSYELENKSDPEDNKHPLLNKSDPEDNKHPLLNKSDPEDNKHPLLNKKLFKNLSIKLLSGHILNDNEKNKLDSFLSCRDDVATTIICDSNNFERFSNYDKTEFLIFQYHTYNTDDKYDIDNDDIDNDEVLKFEIYAKYTNVTYIKKKSSNFILLNENAEKYVIIERDIKFVNIGKNRYKIIK
jgi:hypothetical protein